VAQCGGETLRGSWAIPTPLTQKVKVTKIIVDHTRDIIVLVKDIRDRGCYYFCVVYEDL